MSVRGPEQKDVCSEVADGRPVPPRRRGRGPLAAEVTSNVHLIEG